MELNLPCIFIYLNVCLALYNGTIENDLRIKGGRYATEDEFPYVVRLMLQSLTTRMPRNRFICTGVVLSSKWTLTARHCIIKIEEELEDDIEITPTKAVVEYKSSPKAEVAYSEIMSMSQPRRYDIGLLHTQPVLFAKYGKLSPIDYAALSGQVVSVVGFGWMKMKLPRLVPQVLEVIVQDCSAKYHSPRICFAPSCGARGAASQAVCPGDSGGPAVHVSGIVSVSTSTDLRDCGLEIILRRNRYDVGYNAGTATPVSPFLDWISTVMRTEIA